MESECVTLRNMLEERNNFITTMKSEIYRKEYRNDTQRVDLQNQILQKDATIKKLEVCVKLFEVCFLTHCMVYNQRIYCLMENKRCGRWLLSVRVKTENLEPKITYGGT